jgi:hypothetical protein
LIDDPDIDAVAEILAAADHDQPADDVLHWDEDRAGRVRRRLRAVRVRGLPAMIADLTQAGLIDRPAT